MTRFVKDEFGKSSGPTVGGDFLTANITLKGKKYTLHIWDTAGQEKFESISNTFYRDTDACIIVFDITDKSVKNFL